MNDKAATILDRVRATLDRYSMLESGNRCLLAVSGGPDSMCLAQVFHELSIPFAVAHLDHGTREGESAADAAFVRDAANGYGVPCFIDRRDLPAEARASSDSFEKAAREARYTFLESTASEQGFQALATGHHANDQAETVLMRLLRGAGPGGLGGIPPVRQSGGVRIIRPLIECTREKILAFLQLRGVAYRVDHTNADTRYPRNRIRHELLPLLTREYNPQAQTALVRLAEMQRDEDAFLNGLAEEMAAQCRRDEVTLDREVFAKLPRAMQRRVVVLLSWECGIACPFERIETIRRHIAAAPAGKACDLGQGVLLRNSRNVTEIVREPVRTEETAVALSVPGETEAFGLRYTVGELAAPPSESLAAYCTPARQVFDADALGTDLAVRFRRPGDRFAPLGLGGTKKLKDYFIALGLTERERARQPLLTAGEDIVWVVGRAVSQTAAVTPATRRIVEVKTIDATQ